MPYLMQAASSVDGELSTWVADEPDFDGEDYPGAGDATDVVIAAVVQSAPEPP